MANNPKKVTILNKVTDAQLEILASNGTVTKGGDTLTADEGAAYLTPDTSVSYKAQTLTSTEKAQARTNIGAGTSSFSGSYNDLTDKPTIPTVNNATLTIQKNGTTVDTFTANASSDKTINITVPTSASDVSALPSSTKYGASLELSINSSTYVVTATLKDQDGNTLGTAQTIDLPLESVVVSGSYDSANKKVVLTLQSGSTVEFSVADLVSGLQTELSASNKLNADYIADGTTNKAYTATEQTKLSGIAAGAEVNVQSDWNQTDTSADDYIKNKPTIPTDTNQKIKTSSVTFGNDDVVQITAGSNITVTGDATNKTITIAATDTTYSSQSAAQGGTTESLVTTGEKYTWNAKQNALPTTSTAGKVLKSTSTAGTVEWGDAPSSEVPKTTIATSGAVSQTIQPNNYYEFTSDALTSLTLTQAAPTSGKMSTYYVRFYSGTTAPTLTVTPNSETIKWNSLSPNLLNANTYYDLIIRDNVASLVPTHTRVGLYTDTTLSNNPDAVGVGGSVVVYNNSTNEEAQNSLVNGVVYRIVATPDTNFSVNKVYLNGVEVSNNSTFTAVYTTTVIAEFIGNTTTLTYNTPTGANVVVKKASSTGDNIPSGSTVRTYDDIYISVSSQTGYTTSYTTSGLTRKTYLSTNNYYVTAANPSITVTATASS